MGVVIESSTLAAELAQIMECDMSPKNAWRLFQDVEGAIRWRSLDQELTRQPARSLWQRFEDILFMAFPRDLY